jgi:hypothetical protein
VLSDGAKIEAEVVGTGAGYVTAFDYLSDEIKQILQYDDTDKFLSTVAYRSILHPSLPGLAFLGIVVNGAPCKYDLQAEIAIKHFLGTLQLTQDEMWLGVRDEERLRTLKNLLCVPYSRKEYVKECMRILQISPDYSYIQNELKFGHGMFLPQFLFLERPGQIEIATKVIEEIREKYPSASQLNM